MKSYIHSLFAPSLAALLITSSGCGKIFLKMTSGEEQGTASFKLDDASVFNDFEKRCGSSMAQISDSSKPLFALKLKSLPVVIKAEKPDFNIEAKLEITAHIESRADGGFTEVDAKLISLDVYKGEDRFNEKAKEIHGLPVVNQQLAQIRGRNNGGATPAPTTLLKQYREDGQYKGIFCSVGFSLGSKDQLGGESGEISMDKPVILAINPMAALSTFESELGDEKTITSNVTIVKAKKDWLPAGTVVPITIKIRKIPADLKKLEGLPADTVVPALSADIAYEISITGPANVSISKFGMTKRSAFFIDTKRKTFSAVVIEADKENKDNIKVPPVVLIPEGQASNE